MLQCKNLCCLLDLFLVKDRGLQETTMKCDTSNNNNCKSILTLNFKLFCCTFIVHSTLIFCWSLTMILIQCRWSSQSQCVTTHKVPWIVTNCNPSSRDRMGWECKENCIRIGSAEVLLSSLLLLVVVALQIHNSRHQRKKQKTHHQR